MSDLGKDNIYLLDQTPGYKEILNVRKNIAARVKKAPDERFLIIFAMAGHGM